MAKKKPKKYGPISAGTFISRSRSVSSEEKAMHNNAVREFFDLRTEEDRQVLGQGLERLIADRLHLTTH